MGGRKHTPQPLALATSNNDNAATAIAAADQSQYQYQRQQQYQYRSNGPEQPAPPPQQVVNAAGFAPAPAPATASAFSPAYVYTPSPSGFGVSSGASAGAGGETSFLQVNSTTSSLKSPRSPFSRFNPNRQPQSQQPHPSSPSTHSLSLPQSQSQHQPEQVDHPREDCQQDNYPSHEQIQARSEYQSTVSGASRKKTSSDQAASPVVKEGAGKPHHHHHHHHHSNPSRDDEKHSRSASRFFNFNKSLKSIPTYPDPRIEAMSRGADHPAMSDRVSSKTSKYTDQSSTDHSKQKAISALPSKSELSLVSGSGDVEAPNSSKKSKPKTFTLLGRNRSLKDKEESNAKEMPGAVKVQEPERAHTFTGQQPSNTAPMADDRSHRQMMNSSGRNHSADRGAVGNKEGSRGDKDHGHNRSNPSSFRDNSGSAFFSGLKNSGTRAADMISKGLFGKNSRSGSTTEKESLVDDEHYQLKVINLPLVEQTRLTRISKRLEDSRDKTEFWMPAFPWRAIDYLNYKGSDVEGLYRVPGSGPQIKKWQRKFDEEYDVDLFAQGDLYDINIIGSMLKAWLRELPDELFPKEAQERISRECAGAEQVPQLLIDELSNLSPYNYYLLFAITCHLSLLLAHSDKNKMDFRNLCICFQPCMKIDAFCFKFLVCDWRDCWQGCKTESKYIEEEYLMFNSPPPKVLASSGNTQQQQHLQQPLQQQQLQLVPPQQPQQHQQQSIGRNSNDTNDERLVSSSDSGSKQSTQSREQRRDLNGKRKKKPSGTGQSDGSVASIATSLTVASERETSRKSNELRPLSPIKPLSPLGF